MGFFHDLAEINDYEFLEKRGHQLRSHQEALQLRNAATRTVWVLRRWDRHDDVISLFSSEAKAAACLARHVAGLWSNVSWLEDVPAEAPADDWQAINLYYGPQDEWDDEGFTIYDEDVDTD